MSAGAVGFLVYALAHACLATIQLYRLWKAEPKNSQPDESRRAWFVRCGNVFFSAALVCNNTQLFFGGLSTPGESSLRLLKIETAVHDSCMIMITKSIQ